MTISDKSCESTVTGVGERLRQLRHEAGLTQSELATRLGTTQSAVARLERGRHRTSLELIDRVATALGCQTFVLIQQKRSA